MIWFACNVIFANALSTGAEETESGFDCATFGRRVRADLHQSAHGFGAIIRV